MSTLGDRMKQYEDVYNLVVPASMPFLIRLDGRNFSKFTAGFQKPFDENFILAMLATAKDLIGKFTISSAYCHSDEITAVFPPSPNHEFGGRLIKICTLLAGYASARFNYHLVEIVKLSNAYKPETLERILRQEACFDARPLVFENPPQPTEEQARLYQEKNGKPLIVTSETELVNHMVWRSRDDCFRNCIQTYARQYYSEKQLFKVNVSGMIQMLKEKNILVEDIPLHLKNGYYVKRRQVDGKTLVEERTIVIGDGQHCHIKVNGMPFDDVPALLFARYWP